MAGQHFTYNRLTGSRKVLDVQVRVYNHNGDLMATPAGGFNPGDDGAGSFFTNGDEVRFITPTKPVIYNFAETKLASVTASPFPKLSQTSYVVIGASRQGDRVLWYGLIREEGKARDIRRSFVALTTVSGEKLLHLAELPEKYRSPAGTDHQGNLYFFSFEDSQPVLLKTKPTFDYQSPALAMLTK